MECASLENDAGEADVCPKEEVMNTMRIVYEYIRYDVNESDDQGKGCIHKLLSVARKGYV